MIKNTILFAFLSILLSCTDHENLYDREYPLVKTLPSENISSYGATFKATLTGEKSFPAEEFGFIWNKSGYQSKAGSEWKSLGSTEKLGDFSLDISKALEENVTYYVMAYAVYDKKTVYGNVERFTSTPAPKPQLKKLSPSTGTWGDTVNVIGKDFSYIKEKNTVLFGTTISKILEINDTTLKVVVPSTLKEATSPVIVVVSSQKSDPLNFTLKKPVLKSSSKMEIALCDTIDIRGENLPPDVTHLYFGNNAAAKVIKATPTNYKVAVPFINSSINSVTVSMYYSNENFTLPAPLTFKGTQFVSSVPAVAGFLDTVKVAVQNLPRCGLQAQLGSTKISLLETGTDYVKFIVPSTYNVSPIQLQLYQSNSTNLVMSANIPRALTISSISPTQADVNDIITIKGRGFSPIAANNRITLNNTTQVIPVSVSTTEIRIKVPAIFIPSMTGAITVSVSAGGASTTGQFAMYLPKITSITPNPITTNSVITVTGEHLNPTMGGSTLTNLYTGKSFTQLSASPTVLTFQANRDALSLIRDQIIQYGTTFRLVTLGQVLTSSLLNVDYRGMWRSRANFPGETRTGAVTFTIGNQLYFGLGKSAVGTMLKDFWMFDITTNTWTQLVDFPGDARINAMNWSVNNLGYIGSGKSESNTNLSDVWKFTPATQTWTQLSDYQGSTNVSPKALVNTSSTVYATSQLEFWKFNPADGSWAQLNNLPYSIYAGGSITGTLFSEMNNVLYRYDPSTDQWTVQIILSNPSPMNTNWIPGFTEQYRLLTPSYLFQKISGPSPSWINVNYDGPKGTGTVYSFSPGTKIYLLQGAVLKELELSPVL